MCLHMFSSPLLQSHRAMPQTEKDSPEDPTPGAVQEDPFKDHFRMPLWVCASQPTRIKPVTDTSTASSLAFGHDPLPLLDLDVGTDHHGSRTQAPDPHHTTEMQLPCENVINDSVKSDHAEARYPARGSQRVRQQPRCQAKGTGRGTQRSRNSAQAQPR